MDSWDKRERETDALEDKKLVKTVILVRNSMLFGTQSVKCVGKHELHMIMSEIKWGEETNCKAIGFPYKKIHKLDYNVQNNKKQPNWQ